MKTTLFLCLFASSFLFISCSKETLNEPKNPIVGLWTGVYNITAGENPADSLYYSFDLKADSTILVQGLGADGNTYYGTGKWSLSGNNFSAVIATRNLSQTGVAQSVTATYDKIHGKLTAGVVETIGYSFRASFELWRIN